MHSLTAGCRDVYSLLKRFVYFRKVNIFTFTYAVFVCAVSQRFNPFENGTTVFSLFDFVLAFAAGKQQVY